jgi:hypothetical protein
MRLDTKTVLTIGGNKALTMTSTEPVQVSRHRGYYEYVPSRTGRNEGEECQLLEAVT